MHGIQTEDPEALSQLYDRYNGIIKALILRVIHNEAEADDLLQEIFMEIWNQAKNFSAQKGKPLGWMVTLARRRAIDGCGKSRPTRGPGSACKTRPSNNPMPGCTTPPRKKSTFGDTRILVRQVINTSAPGAAAGHKSRIFSRDESARNRRKNEYTVRDGQNPA